MSKKNHSPFIKVSKNWHHFLRKHGIEGVKVILALLFIRKGRQTFEFRLSELYELLHVEDSRTKRKVQEIIAQLMANGSLEIDGGELSRHQKNTVVSTTQEIDANEEDKNFFLLFEAEFNLLCGNGSLNNRALAVFLAIAMHCNNKTKEAWPSLATIGRLSNIIEISNVSRIIAKLVEMALISRKKDKPKKREEGDFRQKPNLYRLIHPARLDNKGQESSEAGVPFTPEQEGSSEQTVVETMSVDRDTKQRDHSRHKKKNLIEPGVYYYHSELQDSPPMPQTYIDEEGRIREVDPDRPYWLEMKKEYTLEDALAYFEFYTENKIRDTERKRALGALQYLVDTYGIDVVLHAIEVAQENYEDYGTRQPTQPIHIRDHIEAALDFFETRKANAEYLGLNKIIPRPV